MNGKVPVFRAGLAIPGTSNTESEEGREQAAEWEW